MGALVTVQLPADSPALDLPWVVTFGPLGDEDSWEPLVCGPYERPHALGLAEAVVAGDDVMAVVEPVLPLTSVEEIRNEIAASRLGLTEGQLGQPDYRGGRDPGPPPGEEEIRAGFSRIAARLDSVR